MNIYARIRKIESPDLFKRFFNTLMGAEFAHDFEAIKEWHDYGIDGYLRSKKIVYAVYCPEYPERREQKQYFNKIKRDIEKLLEARKDKKISIEIKEWCFVTPDDISVDILNFIKEKTNENEWEGGTYSAYTLAPLFMKHDSIHVDFPEITAGLHYDKIPNLYISPVYNKRYIQLEIFNNGTEDIEKLEFKISGDKKEWQSKNHDFLYEGEKPITSYPHTCVTLKKGERQYIRNIPQNEYFYYQVSGIGVESQKTFYKMDKLIADKTLLNPSFKDIHKA